MNQMKFCEKCWDLNPLKWPDTGEIIWFEQLKGGTVFYKDGKPFGAKMYGNTYTIEGITYEGIPIPCSRGHMNFIKDTEEQKQEQIRLQFNFDNPCQYHDVPGSKCTVRQPCDATDEFPEQCIVYHNYLVALELKDGNNILRR